MASRPVLEAFEAARKATQPKPTSTNANDENNAAGVGVAVDPRIERAIALRRLLSPQEMLNADGTIDQDFFKPKQVIIVEDKKWGPAERDALYKGLEVHGVGSWRTISEKLFRGRWDETALRIKAGRLMGTQSLARYVGWKGTKEAVDAEFAKNRELGEATGCWKGGVLVEDDAGSVAAELARRAAAAAAATAAAGAGGGEAK